MVRRCPTMLTPISFRSSPVRVGRTFSLISFSRKAASYCSRPRLRSQTTTSISAPKRDYGVSLSRQGRVSRSLRP